MRREQHCICNHRSASHCIRSKDYLLLENECINSEIGKLDLKFYALQQMENLQEPSKLEGLATFAHLKTLLTLVMF